MYLNSLSNYKMRSNLSVCTEGVFESIFAESFNSSIHVLIWVVYLPKSVNDTVILLSKLRLLRLISTVLNKDDPTVLSFCNLASPYTFKHLQFVFFIQITSLFLT